MCTQHAWKPLVERRMHIETNKHTHTHRLCLFLQRQRTKTKMAKKNYLDKTSKKKIFFYWIFYF
jgi:hypothetical protein